MQSSLSLLTRHSGLPRYGDDMTADASLLGSGIAPAFPVSSFNGAVGACLVASEAVSVEQPAATAALARSANAAKMSLKESGVLRDGKRDGLQQARGVH